MFRPSIAPLCGFLAVLTIFLITQKLDHERYEWLRWRIQTVSALASPSQNTTSLPPQKQSQWAGSILPDMQLDPDAQTQKTVVSTHIPPGHEPPISSKAVVMRQTAAENTSWIYEELPDWESYIYSTDELEDTYPLTVNRGREANAYLTYIIENYEDLPDVVVFMHAHRWFEEGGWHIDDEYGDNAHAVQNLNLNFVQREGYANLRCTLDPGCPTFFQTHTELPSEIEHSIYNRAFKRAWPFLFPGMAIPQEVAAPCCAQFAVARHQILKRPKADYIRFLLWLLTTPEDDHMSGTIMEYLWHVIFGRETVYCPSEESCFCETYDDMCYEDEELQS